MSLKLTRFCIFQVLEKKKMKSEEGRKVYEQSLQRQATRKEMTSVLIRSILHNAVERQIVITSELADRGLPIELTRIILSMTC